MVNYGSLKKYTRELKVLFVEDDVYFNKEFTELLNDIFPIKIDVAYDGEEGLLKYKNYFQENQKYYDLVITDVKMPKLDGGELIKELYSICAEQKVIVLSARSEFQYLLTLLNLGVEHFFPKPIEYDKFLDQLLVICEKIYNTKQESCITEYIEITKDLTWNIENQTLYQSNSVVKLTKMELILLSTLLEQNSRVFTLEELFTALWGGPYEDRATTDNLKNIISRLRRKVPELYIENLYGMGYKLQIK